MEVICTESTTQCSGGEGIADGTCHDEVCRRNGFVWSSFMSFVSGPPCPRTGDSREGSACEPEGIQCRWYDSDSWCGLAQSSGCQSDEDCPMVWHFRHCLSDGLCASCDAGYSETVTACSGGLWVVLSSWISE